MNDFEIIKELGKGVFGTVLLVKRKEDNNIYAIKRVQISGLNQKEKQNALNEIRILASISHQNIIGYKESFFDEKAQTLNLVLEFADDGDLSTKIQNNKKMHEYFTENEIWSIFIQMIQGLNVLHEHQIMHRDLKSANIFLTKAGICKLGDLNVSKVVKKGLLYTQTGTPYFASPEVWMDKPYDYKSDIWSVGCILYEMCSLSIPFKGKNFQEVYKNVINGKYNSIPPFYSEDLSLVVKGLLQVNPDHRPTCRQILEYPPIKNKMNMLLKHMNLPNNSLTISSNRCNLMGTIQLNEDKDIKEILPKYKKYNSSSRLNLLKQRKKINSTTIDCENLNFRNGTKIRPLYIKNRQIDKKTPLKSAHTESNKERINNTNIRRHSLSKNNSISKLILNPSAKKIEVLHLNKLKRVSSLLLPLTGKKERSKTPTGSMVAHKKVKPIIEQNPLSSKNNTTIHINDNSQYTNSTTNTNSNQLIHETPHKVDLKQISYVTTESTARKVNVGNTTSKKNRDENKKELQIPRPEKNEKKLLLHKVEEEMDPFKIMLINPIKVIENKKMKKTPTQKRIKVSNVTNLNSMIKEGNNGGSIVLKNKNNNMNNKSQTNFEYIRRVKTTQNKDYNK